MPAKSEAYWAEKSGRQGTCSYRDPSIDWYWERQRKAEVLAFLAPIVELIRYDKCSEDAGELPWLLDVGCGDGSFSKTMAHELNVQVDGVDAFDYGQEREDGFVSFGLMDAEQIGLYPKDAVELATVNGVLECVSDWRKVLWGLRVAPEVVLVEDVRPRKRVPVYQQGLEYKTPVTLEDLHLTAAEMGWEWCCEAPVTMVDRAWFMVTPRWTWPAVARVSLVVDRLLCAAPGRRWKERWTRFRAVHLIRRRIDDGRGGSETGPVPPGAGDRSRPEGDRRRAGQQLAEPAGAKGAVARSRMG